MKTIYIGQLQDRTEWLLLDDGTQCILDEYMYCLNTDTIKKIEKRLGTQIEEIPYKNLNAKELEYIEQIVIDEREALPVVAPGVNLVSKEDLESYVNDGYYIIYDDDIRSITNDIESFEFDRFYIYWNGRNYTAGKIVSLYEIEVEKSQENFIGDTYELIFYETRSGSKIVFYSSYYQGVIPFVDEDEMDEDIENILEKQRSRCVICG